MCVCVCVCVCVHACVRVRVCVFSVLNAVDQKAVLQCASCQFYLLAFSR